MFWPFFYGCIGVCSTNNMSLSVKILIMACMLLFSIYLFKVYYSYQFRLTLTTYPKEAKRSRMTISIFGGVQIPLSVT